MMHRGSGPALLAAGLLATGQLAAETLEEAWIAALDTHELIAAAAARRDAALRGLDGAKAERMPAVDVTSAFTQIDTSPRFAFGSFASPPVFGNDTFVMTTAQLSVPVFTSGMIRQGVAAAESNALASESQLSAIMQEIKLGVAEAYVQVLRAISALGVVEASVRTLESHTADATNQFDVGAVPRNDLLAASVSLANARQGRLQAQNGLDLAEAAYNRMLGRDLDAPVALDDGLDADSLLPAGAGLDALIAAALADRSELAAFTARGNALHAQSAAVRARTKPHLAVTGGYSRLENDVLDDDAFWTVRLAVQWRMFDSGRTRSGAAALELEANAVAHQRADLETLIALQVRQAWLMRQEAADREGVAAQAVEQADENVQVARNRYQAGAGTNTEVLDAEALRMQSASNLDNARFDRLLATLRLARAIGAL